MNKTNLSTGKQNVWLTSIQIILSFLALSVVEGFIPSATAQEIYACKVIGKVFYKSEKTWLPVSERQKLKESYWIKIEKGGYVTLIRQNGFKTLQGKKISQIKDIKFDKDAGTWSRLYSGLYNVVNIKPKEGVTAISRGVERAMIFPVDGELLIGEKVHFIWDQKPGRVYSFLLEERQAKGKMFCTFDSLNSNNVLLPDIGICSFISTFDPNTTYTWSVTAAGSKHSGFSSFSFAGHAALDSLNEDLSLLEKSANEMDKEIYYLLKGGCYENYRMYSEADKVFGLASKEFSESGLVKEAYEDFLVRIKGLNE